MVLLDNTFLSSESHVIKSSRFVMVSFLESIAWRVATVTIDNHAKTVPDSQVCHGVAKWPMKFY